MRTLTALLALILGPCFGTAQRSITVFAAASLKDAFTVIGKSFETQSGVKVRFSFGGSQQLAAQINAGAPADVFASADLENLSKTGYEKASIKLFARNKLVVVTPTGSSFKSFRDLARAKRLVMAAPRVPAGKYARQMLDKAGKKYGETWKTQVLKNLRSEEQDVRTALTKVQLGEADAGIVYISDAKTSKSPVRRIDIPAEFNVVAEYPVAAFRTGHRDLARKFIDYIMSRAGQAALVSAGFEAVVSPKPAERSKGSALAGSLIGTLGIGKE